MAAISGVVRWRSRPERLGHSLHDLIGDVPCVDDSLVEAANLRCASKRAQEQGSPCCPTNACSVPGDNPPVDCGKERDPHSDEPEGQPIEHGSLTIGPIKGAEVLSTQPLCTSLETIGRKKPRRSGVSEISKNFFALYRHTPMRNSRQPKADKCQQCRS